MELQHLGQPFRLSSTFCYVSLLSIALYALQLFLKAAYYTFFGALSKFPGPKLNAFSILPYLWTVWSGNEPASMIALHKKYGPIVRFAPNRISFLGDSQTWKDIYGFQKTGQQLPYKDLHLFNTPLNGTPSIILANDNIHARHRKILSNAFSDKALKEQEPLMKRWASLFQAKLAEKATSGDKVDMVKMLNCTTFDIMADLTFAEPLYMLENSEYSPWVKSIFLSIKKAAIIRCIRYYSALTNYLIDKSFVWIPSIREQQMRHWKYTAERVDRRLATTPDRPDLWSRILAKGQGTGGLSLAEQHSNAGVFMSAGTETTATALSGILFHLARHPEIMQRVKAELNDAFDSKDDLHLEPLARCKYMEAVLKEGMRVYPSVPVGLPRIIPEGGATINGYFIPEGTNVSIPGLASGRADCNWVDPDTFAPERWLGEPKYANDKRDSVEPFSIGPRNCLGKVGLFCP